VVFWWGLGSGYLSQYSDSPCAGQSGDGIPGAERFPAPVQIGPGAHPDFCLMGTGSSPGLKRPGRGVDYPPSSTDEVKEKTGTIILFPLCGFMT